MSKPSKKSEGSDQKAQFISAARAAECDEDEGRFRARLAKVLTPAEARILKTPVKKKPAK